MTFRPAWMGTLRRYLGLCRPGVSMLAACSALAGCVLAAKGVSARFLIPWAGTLILACGAGALNQVQERETDARMERTKGRPVPAGRIAPARALAFSLLLLLLGTSILAAGGRVAVLLGVLAVAWYNGVYTRLKAVSAFAAVPGALTGAFPPAIGWVCGGGSLADIRLYALCLILFAWQVPHFWLVVMDRGWEYREAGLPGLTEFFTAAQIRRLVSFWILGTAACSLLLSLGSLVRVPATRYALAVISLWLGGQAVAFRLVPQRSGAVMFRRMNLYMVSLLALACSDGFLALLGLI